MDGRREMGGWAAEVRRLDGSWGASESAGDGPSSWAAAGSLHGMVPDQEDLGSHHACKAAVPQGDALVEARSGPPACRLYHLRFSAELHLVTCRRHQGHLGLSDGRRMAISAVQGRVGRKVA